MLEALAEAQAVEVQISPPGQSRESIRTACTISMPGTGQKFVLGRHFRFLPATVKQGSDSTASTQSREGFEGTGKFAHPRPRQIQ